MKKILIVNNNCNMGGIQKSLVNLLKSTHTQYNYTLLLFSKSGPLLNEIPNSVPIIKTNKIYNILGLDREELKKYPFLYILKIFLVIYSKLFSRRGAMKLMGIFQKPIKGYDVVISYSHLPNHKNFMNGSGDFVLDKTLCSNKICLIHCDYLNSGSLTQVNNLEYMEFDKIACCSNSVKKNFIIGTKITQKKIFTLHNFYDLDITNTMMTRKVFFDEKMINIISVSRLSSEKGVTRVIEALHIINRKDIQYFIIGDGPQKKNIITLINQYELNKQVFLVGEKNNPYEFMMNADYLIVPSYHEAAPIVYDEAKLFGLSVITTNTTSANEIIGEEYGIVCDNNLSGIINVLSSLNKNFYKNKKVFNNQQQQNQLKIILGLFDDESTN